MEKLLLKDLSFVTESGKQVILHGVNVLCRGRETGHIYPEIEKAFPYFRRMGFNLLRYGIFWDAVCPLRFFGRDGDGLGGCRCRGEAERCGFRLQRRFGLCGVFGASARYVQGQCRCGQ